MKLTAIILLSVCMAASATGFTQRVTISVKNAPLEKVFAEIKKQTGYSIFYNYSLLEKAKPVTLTIKDASVEEVMNNCLKGQALDFEIAGQSIVIKPKAATGHPENPELVEGSGPLTIDLSGKVTDAEGNPLQGASVKVKGTTLGTTTNADGSFLLKGIDENAILIFSYAEHETVELKVGNRTSITAALKRTEASLQEVIVNKGYYTEKQKLSTGNVSKITYKDIERQPVNNPLIALQGRVPGMFIQQATGVSGGGVNVLIRGKNSLFNGTNPLYVIDGVIYPSTFNYAAVAMVVSERNPLNHINPSDIESIEVLKDADATAIYGSRGANGVVLITTRTGKASSTPELSVNLSTGTTKVTGRMELLSLRQYLDMRYEAFQNDGIDWRDPSVSAMDLKVWDTTKAIDWQKELIGKTGHFTNLQASLAGGSPFVRYTVGAGYTRETAVFPGEGANTKGSFHFSLNTSSPNQKLTTSLIGSYVADINKLPSNDLTFQALTLAPNAPSVYNADGSINWGADGLWDNPIGYTLRDYSNKTYNLIGNFRVGYQLTRDLAIRSSFSYGDLRVDQFTPQPIAGNPPGYMITTGSASFYNTLIKNWSVEPQIEYQHSFGIHQISLIAGSTIQQFRHTTQNIWANGFTNDNLIENPAFADPLQTYFTLQQEESKYAALFGRLNYNYKDKYLLNITGRRDGSSRFGPGQQFANFGAVGAGWIFSRERFMEKSNILSYGKIRASYGISGNDQIGDYFYFNTYINGSLSTYQNQTGVVPSRLFNPDYRWELKKSFEVGLELEMFKNRLSTTANFYRNRASNQIIDYPLPATTGFGSIKQNFDAIVQNAGWEFSASVVPIQRGNFTWKLSSNFTINKNKLAKFKDFDKSTYRNVYVMGESITARNMYDWVDTDPATGTYRFLTAQGTLTGTPNASADRIALNRPDPKFYGGISNHISVNNFELDFLFSFAKQTGLGYYYYGLAGYEGYNQPVYALDRWQKPGQNAEVPRYNTDFTVYSSYNYAENSDRLIDDASFIRLKNVSLSYNLPLKLQKQLHLVNSRIFFQGQNLLTITNYSGLDPETRSSSVVPPLRILTVGIQATLK